MNSTILLAALPSTALASSSAIARIGENKPEGAATTRIVIDRAVIVGLWTDDEDCDHAVRFFADGAFVTLEGASGRWRLDGDG